MPPIRGLRAGLIAAKSLTAWGARKADVRRLGDRKLSPEREGLRREVSGHKGALPLDLVTRLLAAYDVPVVKSGVAKSAEDAMRLAKRVV